MDAQAAVLRRQLGMIGAAGAAGVREHEDALGVIHERLRLGEIGGRRAIFDDEAIDAVRSGLADDTSRAARHLGHHVRAKALDDLVERAMHGRQGRQSLDQPIAARDRLAAQHGLAVAKDGTRRQIAFAVGEWLIELGREAVGEVVQNVFARGNVDLHVAPFVGWNLRKATFHQRLAGRDDLDHGGMTRGEVAIDRCDQRGRLHRGDEVIEEALLGALEGRTRGGFGLPVQRALVAGDIGGLERGVEIIVDDAERSRVGVVDCDLLVAQAMFEQIVFDALV